MINHPCNGRGHGHVTHSYILGAHSYIGADEARNFKISVLVDRNEYYLMHVKIPQ